jgi:hypothetical protein
MPLKESKEFAKTAEGLETLADGIGIHTTEVDFPVTLKEQDIRTQRLSLEKIRGEYEKAQSLADQKSKDYETQLKTASTKIAAAQRILQGYHGLRSQLLKDYGFQPPKPSGRKGKRVTDISN